ncbi:large-conductance mechanosensitive channel protein MscL [Lishizhenia sp.]|uniref:large-conductance mechanosensitive channel protein MscL n=1 Tax=Lishizhenia sp. TaxID=2497594 RepID=UPI00299EAE3A|nr:large-conductance mechanosensitive channel protein MscL [Lishizhenia sp.]MDX1446430.1 large-conductance mechanosensitive channel protein MscL [Lishizhenia sp.]
MLKEFKKFIAKGNVLELAVGLIMATYFGAIVKSLVNDIIMPAVGYAIGGVDFNKLKIIIAEAQPEVLNDAGEVITPAVAEVAIKYGVFINTIIVFIVVAFCVFLVVKAYNNMKERMKKKEEEAPAAPPAPSKEEVLLGEIRDLLKEK